MCVCVCAFVCIFTLLAYQLIFPLCGIARGAVVFEGSGFKTIIKDRDCGRLCENVFMYVCIGRRQGSLLGWVLIPNGRVRTGRVKSVCMWWRGSTDAVCKMVIVA